MISLKKLFPMAVLWAFALVSIPFTAPHSTAQTAPQGKKTEAKAEKAQPVPASEQRQETAAGRGDKAGSAGEAKEQPAEAGPSPTEEAPTLIKTETIDQAGEKLGKKIDQVGKDASRHFGKWINAKAFWGITWLKLFVCVGLLLLVVAVERFVRFILDQKTAFSERRGAQWLTLLLQALSKPLSLFIRVYGVYWALSPILGYFETNGGLSFVHRAAGKAADIGGTAALFWFVYRFVQVLDLQMRKWAASTENTIDDMLTPLLGKSLRVFIVVIGSIMIIQNMTGIEIGPLIASLGIGGLAFALAGKDSIANFLGSLTILLDKPFQVGERIVIDKHDGFVESVGFRSTRIRTLTGNLVSIPNEKIINSTLENIGKRSFLRWTANLGLTYDTPPEKVERAVEIVKELLDNHEGMRAHYPPRVHFNGFNDWNLNIGIFVWYHPANFWDFQAWVQRTCLEIMRRFRDEQIEFAFPTQTVYEYRADRFAEPPTAEDRSS